MATLVILATPNPANPDALGNYTAQAMPLLAAAGGRMSQRLGVAEQVAGDRQTAAVILMDFDTVEAARGVFAGAEYAALIPVRDEAFSQIDIYITDDAP